MEQFLELLTQIQELAGVAIDALKSGGGAPGGAPEGAPQGGPEGAPPEPPPGE